MRPLQTLLLGILSSNFTFAQFSGDGSLPSDSDPPSVQAMSIDNSQLEFGFSVGGKWFDDASGFAAANITDINVYGNWVPVSTQASAVSGGDMVIDLEGATIGDGQVFYSINSTGGVGGYNTFSLSVVADVKEEDINVTTEFTAYFAVYYSISAKPAVYSASTIIDWGNSDDDGGSDDGGDYIDTLPVTTSSLGDNTTVYFEIYARNNLSRDLAEGYKVVSVDIEGQGWALDSIDTSVYVVGVEGSQQPESIEDPTVVDEPSNENLNPTGLVTYEPGLDNREVLHITVEGDYLKSPPIDTTEIINATFIVTFDDQAGGEPITKTYYANQTIIGTSTEPGDGDGDGGSNDDNNDGSGSGSGSGSGTGSGDGGNNDDSGSGSGDGGNNDDSGSGSGSGSDGNGAGNTNDDSNHTSTTTTSKSATEGGGSNNTGTTTTTGGSNNTGTTTTTRDSNNTDDNTASTRTQTSTRASSQSATTTATTSSFETANAAVKILDSAQGTLVLLALMLF